MRIRKIYNLMLALFAGILWLDGQFSAGHASWDFETTTGVHERYDDNITYKSTGELSDMITEPFVIAELKNEEKSRLIKLGGRLYYPFYHRYDEFSHLKIAAKGEFSKELSKYDRISVSESFDHSEEPSDFLNNFGRTIERAEYNHNLMTFGYTRELSRHDKIRVDLLSEWNDFSVDAIRDSGWHGGEFEWARVVASDLEIYLGGGYDIRHFVGSGSSQRVSIFSGLRKDLTHRTRMDLRAGGDLIEDFVGEELVEPFWAASLQTDLDERTRSAIHYSQRHQTSPFAEDIFDAWEIRGTFERGLTPKMNFQAEFFYGEGEYLIRTRSDDFAGVSLGLSYEIKKDVEFEISAVHTDLSSTEANEDYIKNTVQAGLKMKL